MKRYSVEDVMGIKDICYSKSRVLGLWGKRKRLSVAEILQLDIPIVDRLWFVFQPGVLEHEVLVRFAADCLERMFKRERANGMAIDPRTLAVVPALRRDADGKMGVTKMQLLQLAAEAAIDHHGPLLSTSYAAALAATKVLRCNAWVAADYIAAESAVSKEDQEWQVERLLYYIEGTKRLPKPKQEPKCEN